MSRGDVRAHTGTRHVPAPGGSHSAFVGCPAISPQTRETNNACRYRGKQGDAVRAPIRGATHRRRSSCATSCAWCA